MAERWEPTIGTDPWAVDRVGARRRPRPRERRRAWSLLIPPVALALVASIRGQHPAIVAIAVVLAVAALVLVLLAPARSRSLAEVLGRVARGVGEAVALALVLVVALPVLYLPGAVLRAVRSLRRTPDHGWLPRRDDPAQERRLAPRPFGLPGPGVWRRQLVGGVVVLVAAAGVVVALDRREPATDPPPTAGADPLDDQDAIRFSDLPAFDGVPFADALKAEQDELSSSLREDPVTGLAVPDFEGTYTNVDDGVRTSLEPTCSCPTVRLWLVGGSAAFGLGQRDDRTIASELVRLAEEDGIALEVTNLAVPGWTADQEVRAVEQRLQDGAPAPDLVVSYTGYNDVVAALLTTVVEGRFPDGPLVFDASVVDAYVADDRSTADLPGGGPALAEATAARIDELAARLRSVVEARGGTARSFFQADALASDEQFAPVREVYKGLPGTVVPDLREQLDLVAASSSGLVDLRSIYDDVEGSVFADWVHTNELGAQLAARAVYEQIAPDLEAAAR